jgi:F0F1-type ATP synthase membrane subunit b/b'
VIPILVVGVIIINRAWPFLIFFAVLAVFAVGIYHLAKLLTGKHLLKMMVPYEKKIEELAGQHEAKSVEAAQSHDRYKELVQEFMDMDPLAQNIGQSDSQSR